MDIWIRDNLVFWGKDEDIFKFVIRIRDKSNPISTISQEPRPEERENNVTLRYLPVLAAAS